MQAFRKFSTNLSSSLFKPSRNISNSYKSALSLSNIYPNSSLKLTTPTKPDTAQSQDFDGYIPLDQLEITYSRSSGPGGQNVNKVNTKVDVRFHLEKATWLSDNIKEKVLDKNALKITKEGHLIFRSDVTRSQQLNLADCLEKVRKCIRDSLFEKAEPSPETKEKIRRRVERANRERIAQKRIHGAMLRERRGLDIEV